MFAFTHRFSLIAVMACILLVTLPITSQAASDEEIAAMRLQMKALSERLDMAGSR